MPDNYEVGYKKPPKSWQFKPGKSGNSSGRPKKDKSQRMIFNKVFCEEKTIVRNGEKVKMTGLEVANLKLQEAVMKGNLSAIKVVFQLAAEHAPPGLEFIPPFLPDRDVIIRTSEESND